MHAPPGVELALVELRPAARPRHPQDRQRPERVGLGEDKSSLEIPPGIVHRLVDRAGAQHLSQSVDRAVMDDDASVWILLSDFL
jgi:hypothetical protein